MGSKNLRTMELINNEVTFVYEEAITDEWRLLNSIPLHTFSRGKRFLTFGLHHHPSR